MEFWTSLNLFAILFFSAIAAITFVIETCLPPVNKAYTQAMSRLHQIKSFPLSLLSRHCEQNQPPLQEKCRKIEVESSTASSTQRSGTTLNSGSFIAEPRAQTTASHPTTRSRLWITSALPHLSQKIAGKRPQVDRRQSSKVHFAEIDQVCIMTSEEPTSIVTKESRLVQVASRALLELSYIAKKRSEKPFRWFRPLGKPVETSSDPNTSPKALKAISTAVMRLKVYAKPSSNAQSKIYLYTTRPQSTTTSISPVSAQSETTLRVEDGHSRCCLDAQERGFEDDDCDCEYQFAEPRRSKGWKSHRETAEAALKRAFRLAPSSTF